MAKTNKQTSKKDGQDILGQSKINKKVILAIFRQNRVRDGENIKCVLEDYIFIQIVRLHNEVDILEFSLTY